MTRINVVPVQTLKGDHLFAEWRELPRIFTAVHKAIESGKQVSDFSIPSKYKLGSGHVTFFYDKCDWLQKRFIQLTGELKHRNYNISTETVRSVLDSANKIPSAWKQGYAPDHEAMYLSMARLAKRSNIDSVLEELIV